MGRDLTFQLAIHAAQLLSPESSKPELVSDVDGSGGRFLSLLGCREEPTGEDQLSKSNVSLGIPAFLSASLVVKPERAIAWCAIWGGLYQRYHKGRETLGLGRILKQREGGNRKRNMKRRAGEED